MQVGPTIIASTTAVFTPVVTLSLNVSPNVIASTTALFQPTFTNDTDEPEVPETPSTYNPTGGGGPAIYNRAYHRELRRTIRKAAGLLKEAPSKRAKRRRIKKVAKELRPHVEIFVPEAIPEVVHPDYKGLYAIGEQISILVKKIDEAKENEARRVETLQRLLEEYEREEARFQRREEEMMLLLIAEAT